MKMYTLSIYIRTKWFCRATMLTSTVVAVEVIMLSEVTIKLSKQESGKIFYDKLGINF